MHDAKGIRILPTNSTEERDLDKRFLYQPQGCVGLKRAIRHIHTVRENMQ